MIGKGLRERGVCKDLARDDELGSQFPKAIQYNTSMRNGCYTKYDDDYYYDYCDQFRR